MKILYGKGKQYPARSIIIRSHESFDRKVWYIDFSIWPWISRACQQYRYRAAYEIWHRHKRTLEFLFWNHGIVSMFVTNQCFVFQNNGSIYWTTGGHIKCYFKGPWLTFPVKYMKYFYRPAKLSVHGQIHRYVYYVNICMWWMRSPR